MEEVLRENLYEQLLKSEFLEQHEVLQIILQNAFPFINAERISGILLDRFPNVGAVLKASPEELGSLKGVDRHVGQYLYAVGRAYQIVSKEDKPRFTDNLGQLYSTILSRFNDVQSEILELYYINKSFQIYHIDSFSQDDRDKVTVAYDTVCKKMIELKPYCLLAAHNHVDASPKSSQSDDDFTNKLIEICNFYNIIFLDHLIFGENGKIYSYYSDGKVKRRSLTWRKNYAIMVTDD